MEEVIGSIPIRSTNQLNNLNRESAHKRGACVMVCVIPPILLLFERLLSPFAPLP
jgi:hypothetical protein